MKSLIVSWGALCLALTPAVRAGIVSDLGDPQTAIVLHRPEKNLQSATHTRMPDGKPALRFNWDSTRAHYFEFGLQASIPLPEFDGGQIRVNIYVPKDCAVRNLNIRLRDRHGEHLQYRQPLSRQRTGWQEIIFPIDPNAEPNAGSWGGGKNANKKIDFPVSLIGFASEFQMNTGDGWLGFGNIAFDITDAPPELALETGKGSPIHVLLPEEKNLARLNVTNRRPDSREFLFEYKLSDAYGRILKEDVNRFKLAPLESKIIPLPPPPAFGVYIIDAKLYQSAGNEKPGTGEGSFSLTKKLGYAYMNPAGPTSGRAKGFLFGLCLHSQRFSPDVQKREALAASWSGAKVYREDIVWRHIQTSPDTWDWSRYDSLIDLYAAQNMELQGIFIGTLAWNSKQMHEGDTPPAEWGEFVRRFTERYRDRVRYMEVWNEPNHGNTLFVKRPDFYVKLMEMTWREAKRVAPEMVILTGGFSEMIGSEKSVNFTRHALSKGKGFYDVIAFHGHGALPGYMPHLNAMFSMQREFGITDIPWYANETGQPTNWGKASNGSTEMAQGETLFKKLLTSWALGSIGYNWYELRDGGFDPNNVEHNYGLLTHDFYPKPAYVVYNMLSEYFREAGFLRPLGLGDNLNGYLFRSRGGDFLLPAWSNDSSDRLVHVNGVKGQPFLVDLFGNETPLPVINGSVALAIGPAPVLLRITQQTEPPLLSGEFATCDENLNIASGGQQTFRLQLHNPSKAPLSFSLRLTPPNGITGERLQKKFKLRPGQHDEFSSVLNASDGFYSLPERLQRIKLDIEIRGSNGSLLWNDVMNREIHTLTAISDKGFNRPADFNLSDASQITRLVASAVSNEPYYWKGPQDLSARIWLGRKGQNLLIKTVVTDDVHAQPYRGVEAWKGDNVQIALQLPGQSGLWEIGLTRHNDRQNEVFAWLTPADFDAAKAASQIALETSRDESAKTTTYEATIPFSAIGLTEKTGQRGFRFNLLVNDNDGNVRESHICIAPGIADEKSPRRYPTVSFR
ncbi:beta-1,4-xylanase [Opitutaceae bacterium TAV1]|nr:beta-1,4-xylanase [Opitutaceae bacterium TAV1]